MKYKSVQWKEISEFNHEEGSYVVAVEVKNDHPEINHTVCVGYYVNTGQWILEDQDGRYEVTHFLPIKHPVWGKYEDRS